MCSMPLKIVVKVGSALIVDSDTHLVKTEWLQSLAEDVEELVSQESEVIIVSSGAIAMARKDFQKVNGSLPLKQALSTIGQPLLANEYSKAFSSVTSQILLTADDLRRETGRKNFIHTIDALRDMNVIPIINENDAVATEEIQFGDNDKLAAFVAEAVQADALIILTRSNGLYTADPETDINAEHIPSINGSIPELFKSYATGTTNPLSTGGMKSKLEAAEIALQAGITVFIGNGTVLNPLRKMADKDEVKTILHPA